MSGGPAKTVPGGRVYVRARLVNLATGEGLAGGQVTFWSEGGLGSFSSERAQVEGDYASTEWVAGSVEGEVTLHADFGGLEVGAQGGAAATGSMRVEVAGDRDGGRLEAAGTYVTSYPWPASDLPSTAATVEGFLEGMAGAPRWEAGHRHANSRASANYFESLGEPFGGSARWHGDAHDVVLLNGHGDPDFVYLYGGSSGDNLLMHFEAKETWGAKDLEWVGLKTCLTMAHAPVWSETMAGLHQILGFRSVTIGSEPFGRMWAERLVQRSASDPGDLVHRAWFLTSNATQPDDVAARVILESREMMEDHLWGNGFVAPDPAVDETYAALTEHWSRKTPPTAHSPSYTTGQWQTLRLDGSGSSDPDGDYLIYIWDKDINENCDSGDYDRDGVDEADDDGDAFGVFAETAYGTTGTHVGRLMVFDDGGLMNEAPAYFSVEVTGRRAFSGDLGDFWDGAAPLEVDVRVDPDELPDVPRMVRYEVDSTDSSVLQFVQMMASYGTELLTFHQDAQKTWVSESRTGREFSLNEETGAFGFVDRQRMYVWERGLDPPLPDPPDDALVKQTAEGLLASYGILPAIEEEDVFFAGIRDLLYGEFGKGTDFPEGEERVVQRTAVFHRKLASTDMGQIRYPVVGPGGKIHVALDENGEAAGLLKVWRDVTASGTEDLVAAEDVLDALREHGPKVLRSPVELPPFESLIVTGVSLGYYEEDMVTPQQRLEPVYVLQLRVATKSGGTVDFRGYVSAASAPLIVSSNLLERGPNYFQADETIGVEATVQGGTGPYAFSWSSDLDGELGMQQSMLLGPLSVTHNEEDQILAHALTLEVTDALGRAGYAVYEVLVSDLPNVSFLQAEPADGRVRLTWMNPDDPDVLGVRVVRTVGGYAHSPDEGEIVYEGTGESVVDPGLANGVEHFYRVFCGDSSGNTSSGAMVSATPDGPAKVEGWGMY